MKVPTDEFDGKVVYGQKRKANGKFIHHNFLLVTSSVSTYHAFMHGFLFSFGVSKSRRSDGRCRSGTRRPRNESSTAVPLLSEQNSENLLNIECLIKNSFPKYQLLYS